MAVDGNAKIALERYPDRFIASTEHRPEPGHGRGPQARRRRARARRQAAHCWGTGLIPQVPLNDKKMYPIYAKCIELDIPIFVYAGVPGPRIRFAPQEVALARRGVLVLPRAEDHHAPRRSSPGPS